MHSHHGSVGTSLYLCCKWGLAEATKNTLVPVCMLCISPVVRSCAEGAPAPLLIQSSKKARQLSVFFFFKIQQNSVLCLWCFNKVDTFLRCVKLFSACSSQHPFRIEARHGPDCEAMTFVHLKSMRRRVMSARREIQSGGDFSTSPPPFR